MNFHFIRCFTKLVVCFISPRQGSGIWKHTTRFVKHRMKWKFIWDPIHVYIHTLRQTVVSFKVNWNKNQNYMTQMSMMLWILLTICCEPRLMTDWQSGGFGWRPADIGRLSVDGSLIKYHRPTVWWLSANWRPMTRRLSADISMYIPLWKSADCWAISER